MKRIFLIAILFTISALSFFWINFAVVFSDVEVKGASEITEWVKLAVAVVSLLVGLVNLRLALKKSGTKE